MQRSRVLFILGLLCLGLWLELRVPAPARDTTFSNASIQEAVLRLQPALERALDQPFNPPIDVRVVTPPEMADVLASDMRLFAREGNERDGVETWAPLLGRNLATMVFAKVELGSSRLNVTPRVFWRLEQMSGGMFHLTTPAFRDALLLHEMVHVYQMRRIDAPKYFGRPDTVGKLQACSSVIEGHAQYVAARVARHLKMNEAFADLRGVTTGEIEGLPESSRRVIRMASGMQAFPYYRGQQMVERIVRDRGYEEGVAAMLQEPPPDEIAVVTPKQYLPTPPDAARYVRAVNRVVRYLDGGEHNILSSVDLRLEWDDVPLERMRSLLNSFVAGDRIHPNRSDRVELYRCRDATSTAAFLDVLEFRIVDEETPWHAEQAAVAPDVTIRYLKRKPGTDLAKQKPWKRTRALLMTTGPVCIVLRLKKTSLLEADLRLARHVHELVRSAYTESPWSNARGDALAPAFIAALSDPHWGVRWRATRNLGRLDRQTTGVEAAAVQAMSDKDPSVRIAAIETFVQWDAVELIPQSALDALLHDDEDAEVRTRAQLAAQGVD